MRRINAHTLVFSIFCVCVTVHLHLYRCPRAFVCPCLQYMYVCAYILSVCIPKPQYFTFTRLHRVSLLTHIQLLNIEHKIAVPVQGTERELELELSSLGNKLEQNLMPSTTQRVKEQMSEAKRFSGDSLSPFGDICL